MITQGMTFISDLGKIIVFLFLLLSVFLITAKSRRKLPDYLFAAFLLVSAIDFSGFFLSIEDTKAFMAIKLASVLLQMPLYYLYVISACYYNFRLHQKHLLHLLPFVWFFCVFTFFGPSKTAQQLFDLVALVQYYGYILAVFLALRTFRRLYQQNYSANHQLTYKWLVQTTVLFVVGNFFVLIRALLPNTNPLVIYLYAFTSIFALAVVCWFVLNALYRPNLFAGIDRELVAVEQEGDGNAEPAQLNMLLGVMESEKPYLDDKLTLQKLAEQVKMPEKKLSLLINQHAGQHYFDFINAFRVNDAKTLLREHSELTVLEVLYKAGFNSKSSFYTAFKKELNVTPTAYRKSFL